MPCASTTARSSGRRPTAMPAALPQGYALRRSRSARAAPNRLAGTVAETAYIGVATQLVVKTPAGTVQVFAQNIDSGSRVPAAGSPVTLSWSPESTFVVESTEEEEEQ